ncbi:three-Cys-motif partner protein TcmP [Paracraurococcus lichenis]|uniref:Three-Cys-motif partner protein TcmP n=1 Tax=Paracraurococcus lichenis TaxID=3064888 RepID=A0ABT9DVT7_9PROT|nr:three-Cys-motif partner protein TcmP [Paracraurococcus sp. LOR1-02]MDO9707988.1 three-Cys-motif partner protein TcmP [Paracraurococcus sp. LOR1-02]
MQEFGAEHTLLKQEVVLDYLRAYLTVMRKQRFRLSYIDAFAGSGWRRSGTDAIQDGLLLQDKEAAMGCALSVLRMPKDFRFHRYVLGDLMRGNVRSLRAAYDAALAGGENVPPPEAVQILRGDANRLVEAECQRLEKLPNDRAVMFLDPYGMQVSWRTLERIAISGKIDLWLLVPTGMALARVMPRHGDVPPSWRKALDRFFGGPDWKSDLFTQTEPDLFGVSTQRRDATLQDITDYVLRRLRDLFGPGVHPSGLDLSIAGRRSYLLAFACANRNSAAFGPALRIADHLMREAKGAR